MTPFEKMVCKSLISISNLCADIAYRVDADRCHTNEVHQAVCTFQAELNKLEENKKESQ